MAVLNWQLTQFLTDWLEYKPVYINCVTQVKVSYFYFLWTLLSEPECHEYFWRDFLDTGAEKEAENFRIVDVPWEERRQLSVRKEWDLPNYIFTSCHKNWHIAGDQATLHMFPNIDYI